MAKAQACPVCGGRGLVLSSFYPDIPQDITGAGKWVRCRSCGGAGYIIVPEEGEK